MRIVVLAGGNSNERDVSLVSGTQICDALKKAGHNSVLVDVCNDIANLKSGDDFWGQTSELTHYSISSIPPINISKSDVSMQKYWGNGVLEICKRADVVFLALHGGEGENGRVQATFDLINVRYTGSGYLPCALSMNKILSKSLMIQNGVPTPAYAVVDGQNLNVDNAKITALGFPCVVKPVSEGSSIGVNIVSSLSQLNAAIYAAQEYGNEILIEQYIEGREFSVSILGDTPLPVIEIITSNGFYDYEKKYQPGLAREVCPAQISKEAELHMQEYALKLHRILGLSGYSRIDFIMTSDETLFCLEANALPGMTPTSLLPQEALAAGISYVDLCNKIVMEAV